MKRLVYLLLLILLGQTSNAQQLPLYSQYLYNKFLINPAIAGSDGFTSFSVTTREQWIGYSGAPRTYSLAWQTRLLKKTYRLKENIFNRTVYRPKTEGKVGLGAYVFSDRNGHIHRTGFQATYSYHTWLEDYTQLSLGLALTGYHLIFDVNNMHFEDPSDEWLNSDLRKGVFIPDADFGVYLLNPKFSLGLSAQQLFGAIAKLGQDGYNPYRMDRHYYLFGSYSFYHKVEDEFEPSILLKMSEQLRPQADIGLTYYHERNYWAGLTYRTGGALIANIGMRYKSNRVMLVTMFFGYSFDFALNEISRATYGTHELTLALKFGDVDKRFNWIDRY